MGIGAVHWVVDPSDDPWLRGLHASEPVLHWHGDRIRLPKEASLLGSSLHCPEQLFRIGRPCRRSAVPLGGHRRITEALNRDSPLANRAIGDRYDQKAEAKLELKERSRNQ